MIVLSVLLVLPLVTLAETLIWWRLWSVAPPSAPQTPWHTAVIFVTGISDYSDPELSPEQTHLLKEVQQVLQPDFITHLPFPYDGTTPQRFARYNLWGAAPPLAVISLHNLWQTALVLIFRQVYGRSVAGCMLKTIPPPSANAERVVFICGSAGAALVLSAAKHLRRQWSVPLVVIAYGGVFNTEGLGDGVQFYSLEGKRDRWIRFADLLLPSRWLPWGTVAQAKETGAFQHIWTGPHQHHGRYGYLGDGVLVDNKTAAQITTDHILTICHRIVG